MKVNYRDTGFAIFGLVLITIGVQGVSNEIYSPVSTTPFTWVFAVGLAIFGGMVLGAAISKSAAAFAAQKAKK